MKTQQFNKKRMGFSLIELSIVILVIGILVLGVTKGSLIINKAKSGSAKSLTQTSPVPLISDLVAWYEPTLDSSFSPSGIANGGAITTWQDNSPTRDNIATVVDAGTTYNASAINNLPAVSLTAASELTFNSLPINGKDYTVFIVERRGSANTNATILNLGTGAVLGYMTNTTIGDSAPATTDSSATVDGFSASLLVPRISTFASTALTTRVYVNGTVGGAVGTVPLTASTTSSGVIGSDTATANQGYVGNVSEVIIYNRALSVTERNDIQNYLSKKYAITVALQS